MFWRRKPQQEELFDPESEMDPPGEAPPRGELVPIRIFTGDEILAGWTHVGSQRMSDVLNAEDVLSVSRVEDEPTEDDWQAVERERMMLVIPPSHSSPRQLRVHRQKREIKAESAHYAIRGTVHLIPGNQLDRTVLRTRQHFLPITDARVATAMRPDDEEEHEVVLVNVVNIGEDLTLEVVE